MVSASKPVLWEAGHRNRAAIPNIKKEASICAVSYTHLAACGYDMTGVDVSVDMLQKAMEKQTGISDRM